MVEVWGYAHAQETSFPNGVRAKGGDHSIITLAKNCFVSLFPYLGTRYKFIPSLT